MPAKKKYLIIYDSTVKKNLTERFEGTTDDGAGFYQKGALYSGETVTLYAVWRPMDK